MGRPLRSATHRMEAARNTSQRIISERNRLVSVLAALYPSHLCDISTEANPDAKFTAIVCIHTPVGQIAWKLPETEIGLFKGLPRKPNDWDGHTTEQKHERITALAEYLRNR